MDNKPEKYVIRICILIVKQPRSGRSFFLKDEIFISVFYLFLFRFDSFACKLLLSLRATFFFNNFFCFFISFSICWSLHWCSKVSQLWLEVHIMRTSHKKNMRTVASYGRRRRNSMQTYSIGMDGLLFFFLLPCSSFTLKSTVEMRVWNANTVMYMIDRGGPSEQTSERARTSTKLTTYF